MQYIIGELSFEEYMIACYRHAAVSGFFTLFNKPEDLIFAQSLWARKYWMVKNGNYID